MPCFQEPPHAPNQADGQGLQVLFVYIADIICNNISGNINKRPWPFGATGCEQRVWSPTRPVAVTALNGEALAWQCPFSVNLSRRLVKHGSDLKAVATWRAGLYVTSGPLRVSELVYRVVKVPERFKRQKEGGPCLTKSGGDRPMWHPERPR